MELIASLRAGGSARLRALVVVAGMAAVAPGCGSGVPPPSSPATAATAHGLTVTPAVGGTGSAERFRFRRPPPLGSDGRLQTVDELSVMRRGSPRATPGRGCVSLHTANAGSPESPSADSETTVVLGLAQLGGRWCPGLFSARVEELARPVCLPGQMCPQFVRLVAVLGPVAFRIR